MNFLEPWGLLGLSALLPIVALYFLKLRREERSVPSTLLWKKVLQDLHVNAPFQRLRYSLLLLLQLLLVALLGFALARPFFAMSATEAKRVIFLIDTSASMGTKDAGPDGKLTRLEAALRDARAKIDDMGSNTEMRIVAFDEEVRQLGSNYTQDRLYLKEQLDTLKPRDVRTHAQDAFELAMALAEERANTQVLVLTDGCFDPLSIERLLGEDWKQMQAEMQKGNTEEIQQRMGEISVARLQKFRFVPYGKHESDNIGITGINARTRLVTEKDADGKRMDVLETQVFVSVENFSSKAQDVILTLTTASSTFPPKVIKLKARPRNLQGLDEAAPEGHTVEAARSNEVFRLPLNTTGVVTARIQSPQDAFALDDQAQVVVGYSEGTRVLYVSKGNYFLEKAFVALAGLEFTKISPEEFEKDWAVREAAAVRDYDCVIFESWAPPKWDDGGAIFIGSRPPVSEFEAHEKEVLEGPKVIDWDETHPVMRYVVFGNVTIVKALGWKVPKTVTKLVETSGAPLIVAHENTRVHVVGVAFEVFESDWPLRRSMPLFFKNAITWCTEASPRRRPTALKTGEPIELPPLPEASAATLIRPDGTSEDVRLSATSKSMVSGINSVGLYKLTNLPGGTASDRVYAVNLADPLESDNASRAELQIGDQKLDAAQSAISARREIWRTLAVVGIVLLLAEWFVYHRRIGL